MEGKEGQERKTETGTEDGSMEHGRMRGKKWRRGKGNIVT